MVMRVVVGGFMITQGHASLEVAYRPRLRPQPTLPRAVRKRRGRILYRISNLPVTLPTEPTHS
jgi:hypothetical protein